MVFFGRALRFLVFVGFLTVLGCADMEAFRQLRVSSPDASWCRDDLISSYPPYCNPERW